MDVIKVAVSVKQGDQKTTKLWRFRESEREEYRLSSVKQDIIALFPDALENGYDIQLAFRDSFVGKVWIETDGDLQAALTSFAEEDDVVFRTLFVCEAKRKQNEPESPSLLPPKKRQKRNPPLPVQQSLTDVEKLEGVLDKASKESEVGVDEQPLYIDEDEMKIKCRWCGNLFKGTTLLKHVNQHITKAASHKAARQKHLGQPAVVEVGDTTNPSCTPSLSTLNESNSSCKCQGLYERRFVPLYEDRNAGGTSADKCWREARLPHSNSLFDEQGMLNISCECCTTYKAWRIKHLREHKRLISLADKPLYYKIHDEEVVTIVCDGCEVQYTGTIRALSGAPKGKCLGTASTGGSHPFVCEACFALGHGGPTSLLRKLSRSKYLQHPRHELSRATQSGVNHKHASSETLEMALQIRKGKQELCRQKNVSLTESNNKLLHDSWHRFPSARPFMETLLTLLENQKLSDFDVSFLDNWLGKKSKGQLFQANDQARSLAVLYSNRLGERMYGEIAPMLGLPGTRQAQRLRSNHRDGRVYLPGINDWAIQIAASCEVRPIQCGMDGTRIIRSVELYLDLYLVGKEFPPDVRCFPSKDDLPRAESFDQVRDHIVSVRQRGQYAAEAYSFNLSDISGKLPDMLIGSIPEAKSGVTGDHILALMLEMEKKALEVNLPLVGHCTDSAANALNALTKLASPGTYSSLSSIPAFLGLSRVDFIFFAPFLRPQYPAIAYPCWDHSARTVLRNLMNNKITVVCGTLENTGDGVQRYKIATINDLKTLKQRNPNAKIRYADITPHVRQNCDATQRVISSQTVHDLAILVPESNATQLYLQAAVWTHEPFRNRKFGPPPVVTRSLWAGLMTWRRWRRYVQLTKGLTLSDNFISRAHYVTEELMVHAGILHQLALYLCFPALPVEEYSLRNSGNRGLESIHGIFRGGSCLLPITSANLSFQEFLTRMNKTVQIHQAEQQLQQISGSYIQATKKKRLTCAKDSTDPSNQQAYNKPSTFAAFLKDLNTACDKGDADSKVTIERLVPEIAATLKKAKEWEYTSLKLGLEHGSTPTTLVKVESDPRPHSSACFADLMSELLGPQTSDLEPTASTPEEADFLQASANMLTDVDLTSMRTLSSCTDIQRFLKESQPHREKPSKDRSKRFAVYNIHGDGSHSKEHNVEDFQYWAIYPSNKIVRQAKCFLLGQIIHITCDGKVCHSGISNNPTLQVMLNVYEYTPLTEQFSPAGRTSMCKSMDILLVELTPHVNALPDGSLKLDSSNVDILHDYVPYHPDVNVEERVQPEQLQESRVHEGQDSEDPYIVEQVIEKRFHSQRKQYEFLVKWRGYTEDENTWELCDNIPDEKINEFWSIGISKSEVAIFY